MLDKLLDRKSQRPVLALFAIIAFAAIQLGSAFAQVVQLPTVGTFSLETSVLAPDSGSAFVGGNRRNAVSSNSLGPGSLASGSSNLAAMVTAHATIIDLNELDRMIRSQSGSKALAPELNSQSKPSGYAIGTKGKPQQNAEYEYLAAITHPVKTGSDQMSSDTTYYLSLAANAKQQRHWAAVELYYKLAWQSLPESRRESVLKSLVEARSKEALNKIKDPKANAK